MKKLFVLSILVCLLTPTFVVSAEQSEIQGNFVILWEGDIESNGGIPYFLEGVAQIELAGEMEVPIEFVVSGYQSTETVRAYGYDRFGNAQDEQAILSHNGVFKTTLGSASLHEDEDSRVKLRGNGEMHLIVRHKKGGLTASKPPTSPPPAFWRPFGAFTFQLALIAGFMIFFPLAIIRLKKVKSVRVVASRKRRSFRVIEKRLGRLKWKK